MNQGQFYDDGRYYPPPSYPPPGWNPQQSGVRRDITLLKARLKDQGCISRSRHPKLSKTQEEAEEDVLPGGLCSSFLFLPTNVAPNYPALNPQLGRSVFMLLRRRGLLLIRNVEIESEIAHDERHCM
ncbi:hypothetical protein FRC05_008431 [Tulasnella sp. 425]|nr:hypothetical protein FRC05_008431 [Tulasnella sp. 425]